MVRQKLQPRRFNMSLETMELDAVAVVNEYILLLCDGEVRMVMKESNRYSKKSDTRT